jgi:hypothetical protein
LCGLLAAHGASFWGVASGEFVVATAANILGFGHVLVVGMEIFKFCVVFLCIMRSIIAEQRGVLSSLARVVRKEWVNVLGLALWDVVFLLVYGFFSSFLFELINNVFYQVGGVLSARAPEYTQQFVADPGLLSLLFFDPTLQPFGLRLLGLFALLLVIVFVLFVLFQGFSWWLSLRLLGFNKSLSTYIKLFARLNVLWLVLFVVYRLLRFASALRFTAVQQFSPEASVNVLSIVLSLVFIIVMYFAFVSYVVGDNKKGFFVGRRFAKHIVPGFVLIALYVLLVDVLVVVLSGLNSSLAVGAGVVLLLPFFTVTRLFVGLLVRKYVGA